MELMYIIYLIEVGTNIKMWDLSIGVGIFSVLSVAYLLISAIQADTTRDIYFKDRLDIYFKTIKNKSLILPFVLVFGFGSLFNAFMPSKQTAYLMLGAYGVQTVAETVGKSEYVQKIGKSTLKLVNSAIEKYQKEIEAKPEKPIDNN
ncbi:hypothetical protein phiA019_0048 [Aeromonas phage phiA019]|nr:hypothetical protein phiA009_0052 [Aeromonas phage phiA009]ULG01585.1 hypothetical protein phiA019_0048 [Aeromonas phage phiA019]